MALTSPLIPEDIQIAHELSVRNRSDLWIAEWLRVEEQAIRATFRVSAETAEADAALRDAMLAAWPSFIQQVDNLESQGTSAAGYQAKYRTDGHFTFPSFVGRILESVADTIRPAESPRLRSRTVTHTFDW